MITEKEFYEWGVEYLNLEFGDFAFSHIVESNSKKTHFILFESKHQIKKELIVNNLLKLSKDYDGVRVHQLDYDSNNYKLEEYPYKTTIQLTFKCIMDNKEFAIGDCVVKESLRPFEDGRLFGYLEEYVENPQHPLKKTQWKIKNTNSFMDASQLVKFDLDISNLDDETIHELVYFDKMAKKYHKSGNLKKAFCEALRLKIQTMGEHTLKAVQQTYPHLFEYLDKH